MTGAVTQCNWEQNRSVQATHVCVAGLSLSLSGRTSEHPPVASFSGEAPHRACFIHAISDASGQQLDHAGS